jgi:acyl carrier protein
MTATRIMSFDEFRRFLSDTLGVAEAALVPEAHFLIDLAIDSIKLAELLLEIEDQLGTRLATDAAWEIMTVGDAYNYYVEHLQGAS